MCHIRYDGGKYDFWVVPVDDTYGKELQRINNFFYHAGRIWLWSSVDVTYAATYKVYTLKHLTKFNYINMLCVIQNVVKTLKTFYAPLVMVSH